MRTTFKYLLSLALVLLYASACRAFLFDEPPTTSTPGWLILELLLASALVGVVLVLTALSTWSVSKLLDWGFGKLKRYAANHPPRCGWPD